MPKETLKVGPENSPTEVHVGWNRESSYVQLATKGQYYGREYAEGETDGIYADLNRQQINDLIRNLRKARDQAYGRDE